MIELQVADNAVEEWSAQTTYVADLQRAFQEDAWRNNASALSALVMKCTWRIATPWLPTGFWPLGRIQWLMRCASVVMPDAVQIIFQSALQQEQRAREESERLRQQEREQIAEKQRYEGVEED